MGDRLATIVRGILKDKFIRAIGERKWTPQDEESINKLSDFFTEFDQRIAALERVGETKPDHAKEHCKIPGCIVCGGPATVVEKPQMTNDKAAAYKPIYDIAQDEMVDRYINQGWDHLAGDERMFLARIHSDRARIEALQSEITGLRGLLEGRDAKITVLTVALQNATKEPEMEYTTGTTIEIQSKGDV